MTNFEADKAPIRSNIRIPFTDGTAIEFSYPRHEFDIQTRDKDKFLDSVGRVLRNLMDNKVPEKEDFDRAMSLEGVSLILPDDHGNIDIQKLFSDELVTGNEEDLKKYQG